MKTRWISLIILLALALTGCVPSQTDAAESPNLPLSGPTKEPLSTLIPTQPIQGDTTQMTPSLPTPSASGLEGLIEKAKEDLAQRLSVPVTQINFVEATDVEWSDSSLGCPQPDMTYLQVITPGYRILLESSGNVYEYHSNRDAYFVYCENRVPPIIPNP